MHAWSDRRAFVAFICCISIIFAFASCSEDDAVAPPAPEPDLEIHADSMLVTVSWNPDFEVNKLLITIEGDAWFIHDPAGLTPPIEFGEAPPGAQTIVPALPSKPERPDLKYIVAHVLRGGEDGDHVVAGASRRGPYIGLSTPEGESFIYSVRVGRITPPGVNPEVWEFLGFTAVPNASWKDLPDEGEVETFLNVRPIVVRRLTRDENGIQRLLEYEDLRVAEVDVDGEITSFIWDQVTP